jgi:hypothetical protein
VSLGLFVEVRKLIQKRKVGIDWNLMSYQSRRIGVAMGV